MRRSLSPLAACVAFLIAGAASAQENDVPKVSDPRLVVERVAAAPDIVHPVNLACDRKGRLLVIESHTHFRPANYQGPKHDRIRLFESTKGDGKFDRITTFFEGTAATMDVVVHPDGAVYTATRNEVIRLEDTKGEGKADKQQRVVFLDTKGDYPHNGLSGLAFDSKGNLYFGMGENLGADYKLIGSDGTTIAGGGEGGNVFWCTADGKKLRRVATGFWNPFGICTDIFGRVFAVDNDPDAMPPCRMVHVVEGGDYGYQFRYGRSGRHPFQSWHGQLAGTLPMMTDVGEAPCKILSYEYAGLPREYLGDLLVASWADHRVERYVVSDKGASVKAERKPFVQGGNDFRPVGIAVAPDGSLYVSDWVKRDYNLHNHGAIWHIRMREPDKVEKPADPERALLGRDRSVREEAAQKLAKTGDGRAYLRKQCKHDDVRVRAAALAALADVKDQAAPLIDLSAGDPSNAIRAQAVRAILAETPAPYAIRDPKMPANVLLEMIAGLRDAREFDGPKLLGYLADADPFIRHAAVVQLGRLPEFLRGLGQAAVSKLNPGQRAHVMLAYRAANLADLSAKTLPWFLADTDPEVRFLAVKWIADEKLAAFRPQVVEAMKNPQITVRFYLACATALARLDNQDVSEERMADHFVARIADPASANGLRAAALRLVPPTHKKLTYDLLAGLLKQDDAALQFETVRMLNEHPDNRRVPLLLEVARNARLGEATRAHALLGVAERSQDNLDVLLGFATGDQPAMRAEALRALSSAKLSDAQRRQVTEAGKDPATGDLAARVLGQPFAKGRPKPEDTAAWLKRLEGPADPAAGQRVFFHPRLANCARCHRVDGRGADVGPDLSDIGRTERRHILESILQPSLIVAPHYQTWSILTNDGKSYTGMLMKTVLDEYTYVDPQGKLFKLNTRNIAELQPVPVSIMPNGLADLLTDQEMRDLMAYLTTRR